MQNCVRRFLHYYSLFGTMSIFLALVLAALAQAPFKKSMGEAELQESRIRAGVIRVRGMRPRRVPRILYHSHKICAQDNGNLHGQVSSRSKHEKGFIDKT